MITRGTAARGCLAATGWAALAATALPEGWALRWIVVLLFVFLGPGAALLAPLPDRGGADARVESFMLAVALSISLATLTSTTLLLVEGFSATRALLVLAVLTSFAAYCPAATLPAAIRDVPRKERVR